MSGCSVEGLETASNSGLNKDLPENVEASFKIFPELWMT